MAVAAAVILYHPEEAVIQNIQSYLPFIDKLYLVDNTELQISSVAMHFQSDHKVQVLYDGLNRGIARRLNQVADLAIEEHYNWLLTMDQDSSFDEYTMENYLLCASSFLYRDKTAVFGVEYENRYKEDDNCKFLSKNKLITSGSILNLQLFREVGPFDETLFIDDVDFDYCYRARLKNFEIIQFQNLFLVHQLGESTYRRSLKNMQITHRTLHSPKRIYYMVRNYLYIRKKYKKSFPEDISEERNAVMNRIKNNLLYGSQRRKVISALFSAIKDYLFNQ